MSDTLVPVGIGECQCPDTPHPDGDFVSLRPKLGLAAGVAIQKLVVEANTAAEPMSTAELTGVLAEAYLLHGVADWNLLGADGKPVPVNAESIRAHLLDDFSRSEAAAEAADDLYVQAVIVPLVNRAKASLRTTSTNGSTSASQGGKSKRPKQSKRSSTSTSPMDGTAATSA